MLHYRLQTYILKHVLRIDVTQTVYYLCPPRGHGDIEEAFGLLQLKERWRDNRDWFDGELQDTQGTLFTRNLLQSDLDNMTIA